MDQKNVPMALFAIWTSEESVDIVKVRSKYYINFLFSIIGRKK